MAQNPFAINFGTFPSEYIGREILIDEIIEELNADEMQNPCIMLTGIRGTGKTVTMTAIEKIISEKEEWITIRLNSTRDMLVSLVAKLYDSRQFITEFIDSSINMSKFGIGLNISSISPVADIESALEIILKEIKKRGKKLLVTIDEVSNTQHMREFASSYQLMLREGLPFYMIMAGLYENIQNLENEDNLTFLYRTPRYEMEPLNITLIREKYRKIFSIDADAAMEMAMITRGYPFAYQAVGKYVWESENKRLNDEVLYKVDEALRHYVYNKIWSELSNKDKWYMSYIIQKDKMTTTELLEISKQKKNEFSQYRARLRDKGLIDVSEHGIIKYKLPRFDRFVQNENLYSL